MNTIDLAIENKVDKSGLISLDLSEYYPAEKDIAVIDMKQFLYMELILKEKEYREALKQYDFSIYENKYVVIMCSADAVIPMWAYMLISLHLVNKAKNIVYAPSIEEAKMALFMSNIERINGSDYQDTRVIIKGCGDLNIDPKAYLTITKLLVPYVKSLMYGEPCSNVPIFKKNVIK